MIEKKVKHDGCH